MVFVFKIDNNKQICSLFVTNTHTQTHKHKEVLKNATPAVFIAPWHEGEQGRWTHARKILKAGLSYLFMWVLRMEEPVSVKTLSLGVSFSRSS